MNRWVIDECMGKSVDKEAYRDSWMTSNYLPRTRSVSGVYVIGAGVHLFMCVCVCVSI